ncbi:MAG: hypothetical protein HQL12_00690 [Candidatus Omnitrophica bacterium]|nr:hypothetical protein [Candidatus Omnitrophota bacterium]
MRKLWVMVLGACLISGFSGKAHAQGTPATGQPVQNSTGMEARKQKLGELRAMIEHFREEDESLREQMKEEMQKVRDLRLKIRAMFEEHKKAMDAKRAQLGLPVAGDEVSPPSSRVVSKEKERPSS